MHDHLMAVLLAAVIGVLVGHVVVTAGRCRSRRPVSRSDALYWSAVDAVGIGIVLAAVMRMK